MVLSRFVTNQTLEAFEWNDVRAESVRFVRYGVLLNE